MGKLPDWMPTVDEIAEALYVHITRRPWKRATDFAVTRYREDARAVLALLERKAGEPDGKPDPAPVASAADILAIACPHCRAPAEQTCNGGGLVCAVRIRAARKDRRP